MLHNGAASGGFRLGPAVTFRMFFSQYRRLVYVAISSIIGFAFTALMSMRLNGILSGPIVAVPLGLGLLWLIGVFLVDLIWRIKTEPFVEIGMLPRAAAWSVICMIIAALASLLGVIVCPDPAGVYLTLQRSNIDAHWRVDPVTGLTYFPIAFEKADRDGKTEVPWAFFVLDRHSGLSIANGDLVRPSCPQVLAKRLDAQIYFLRQFPIEGSTYLTPCLITAAPRRERPPP